MISFAIIVKNELIELKKLLEVLIKYKGNEDEIIIIQDTSSVDEDVKIFLENQNNIKSYSFIFKNDFSEIKNYMNSCCKNKWIFNLDADELPHENLMSNIHELLKINDTVDAIWIPRINIVNGITYEHIKKWGWIVNENGWINWPHDAQCRIYKNSENIKWEKPVHEQLVGYKTVSKLPDYEELSIYHIKDIKRQEKQNEFYCKFNQNRKNENEI